MIKCPIFISYFNCLEVPYIESCLSIIDKHVITFLSFFLGGGDKHANIPLKSKSKM